MKIKQLTKRYTIILAAAAVSACLSGCTQTSSEEKELAAFSAEISDFTDYIVEADEEINSLDTTDAASIDRLLEILDEMDVRFQELAELDAPSRYLSVEELADEASENMTLAVTCYHSFFEADEYSQEYADTAYEYYSRAMKRIRYIGYLLAGGEIPEEENVTIYEEENDSNILQKWLSDDDDTESENTSETEATETETSEMASETNTEAAD